MHNTNVGRHVTIIDMLLLKHVDDAKLQDFTHPESDQRAHTVVGYIQCVGLHMCIRVHIPLLMRHSININMLVTRINKILPYQKLLNLPMEVFTSKIKIPVPKGCDNLLNLKKTI